VKIQFLSVSVRGGWENAWEKISLETYLEYNVHGRKSVETWEVQFASPWEQAKKLKI